MHVQCTMRYSTVGEENEGEQNRGMSERKNGTGKREKLGKRSRNGSGSGSGTCLVSCELESGDWSLDFDAQQVQQFNGSSILDTLSS